MDRLAAHHDFYNFCNMKSHRKNTGGNRAYANSPGRSLSLSDRRGLITAPRHPARGIISPQPLHRRLAAKKMGHMTMVMQVMDYDRFSNDDPIGEIILPMRSVKFDNAPVYWKHLQRPTVDKENVGELMLSLCYLPEVNKLAVSVIKARGLPKKDKLGSSDPYVKLWLVQQGVKLEKQKTCVKPQTLAPIFNESFVFNLPDNYKNDVNLVAMMMDYDMISSNDEIGHAIVGPLGPECGTKQWNEVFCHPEIPFARWHKLLPKW